MIARADVRDAVQRLVQRLAEAVPVAWRYDPLFRVASVSAGIALAVLMLRIAGPHDPALDAPATTVGYAPGQTWRCRPGSHDRRSPRRSTC